MLAHSILLRGLISLVTFTGLVVIADPTTAPDDKPSTQPTAKAAAALPAGVDPLVTWKAYDQAMRKGDVDYLYANYDVKNDDHARYATAMAQVDAANGLLMQAVEEKLGVKAAQDVGHKLGDVSAEDAKSGTVTLRDNKTAIIETTSPESGFLFTLVDGVWKHDVSQAFKDDGFDLEEAVRRSVQSAARAKVLRQDFQAGKYATVEALMDAIEESKK